MALLGKRRLTMAALAGTAFVAGRRGSDKDGASGQGHASRSGRAAGSGAGPRSVRAGGNGAAPRAGKRPPSGDGASSSGTSAAGAGVPGGDADKPTQIPAAGWKQILKRAWAEQKEDNIGLLAAGVAFYAFTALFPALIAAVTLYGLVADPAQVEEQIGSLSASLPRDAATLIGDQLRSIASTSSGSLGLGLAVSVFGALFTASGGVGNIIKAVNIAYDEDETRSFIKVRLLALALTLGAIVFLVVAIGLVAVLPAVLDTLGLGSFATVLVLVLRWVGLIAAMMVALAVLYRFAPDRDAPKFTWVGLGAIVATLLWVIGSAGFSFYVSNFGSYGKTYGALAGVIILLLWLYLTAFIVLLGAEINSESEQQTAKDSTVGPEKPMGERGAEKADSIAAG